ncbi:hypothetical protein AUR04nite_27660 [Glutamicibacter uratoxydans]|uniref:Uncharacterized protein n=1 Tax=Glutamicibacter uratoxydans TaxID=43667 RepID=A0A4Y4DTL7_GLUUR|nr:hypothetical protein [Glutamicibacter uratoxydans]GED07234.1 hypothetical protein AUR04nite_27660 [Glutamicibacter uratoxydans]
MSASDFEYNELSLAFTGRVPDAAQRVQQVFAPLGLVGIVEGPNYQSNSTSVQLILAGPEEGAVFVADAQGTVSSRPFDQAVDAQMLSAINPAVAFFNEECLLGLPLPQADTDYSYQDWAVFAGASLRPEHMVIAAAKDKGARWKFWEADGCGFIRYEGERRYHRFSFPQDAGIIVGLIPEFGDINAAVFSRGQRQDFEFSDTMAPLVSFPAGSPAAQRLQTLWNDWFDLVDETFADFGEATGNPRAAAELQRALQTDVGIPQLRELLRNLGISRTVLDYAVSPDAPQGAREFQPKGTLDKVRIIREEIAQRTGVKLSFSAGLRLLKSAD